MPKGKSRYAQTLQRDKLLNTQIEFTGSFAPDKMLH